MKRHHMAFVAFFVGCAVYMIAMVMTVYDGILSLIFQPIMAIICSTLTVGLGLLVGLLFKIPALGRFWRSSHVWAASLVAASLVLMCFGSILGITEQVTEPETGRQITGLHSGVALTCYFILLFSIANWPLEKSKTTPLSIS